MKGSESFLSGGFNDPYGRPGDSVPDNPGELACMDFVSVNIHPIITSPSANNC